MALKQLIANNDIQMTVKPGKAGDKAKGIAPVAPVTETIPTGANFKAQDTDQELTLTSGRTPAARFADPEEKVKDSQVAEVTAEDEDEDQSGDGGDGSDGERSDDEFRAAYAELLGKKAPANMKAENVKAKVLEAETAAADDADGMV